MNRISSNYEENVQWFNDVLGAGRSCDMVCRDLYVGGRRARFWVIDGFGGDAILERMGAFWLSLQPEAVQGLTEMQQFADRYVTFMEVNVSYDRDDIVTSVLMGKSLLVMEGLSGAALIDAKEYPSRSVGEPPVGQRTHSDVALCYLDDRVDHALLDELRHKLQNIQANSLTMAQESVAEAIRPKQWYNPFPKVRYTERPDTAAACVMEGSIILMVDNSAAVMILPTTFFDFTQEANDFYFPPLVGTYLRILRVTVFLISLLITPAWYLMVSSPGRLPSWLDFLSSPEPAALSLLSQLLVVEFLIDVLKLASLNTPDTLSNSFSMLGALILGDFAVQAGWLGPEVLVYMAFVSVAGFAQPSYELGYAFKLLRVALLLLTAAFDVWGFCLGFVGILVLLATTKPLVGHGYLYPLIPFNGKALRRLLVREPINRDNT